MISLGNLECGKKIKNKIIAKGRLYEHTQHTVLALEHVVQNDKMYEKEGKCAKLQKLNLMAQKNVHSKPQPMSAATYTYIQMK